MRVRLIENGTSFLFIPTLALTWSKTWFGYREIALVWLKWYLCLEWGYED